MKVLMINKFLYANGGSETYINRPEGRLIYLFEIVFGVRWLVMIN